MLLRHWLAGLGESRGRRLGGVRRRKWGEGLPESLEVRIVPARVNPYLQNPATDAMTIMWFTQENTPGTVTVNLPGGGTQVYNSTPVQVGALAYHANEVPLLPGGVNPGNPYQHRIRVTGLQGGDDLQLFGGAGIGDVHQHVQDTGGQEFSGAVHGVWGQRDGAGIDGSESAVG